MKTKYDKVLTRLKEERNRLLLSQKDVSKWVKMNQSNYSKVEKGIHRLSYFEVKSLCDSDIDIYYVYTGRKYKGKYQSLFPYSTYEKAASVLEIIYIVMRLKYRESGEEKWENVLNEIEYIRILDSASVMGSIFLSLRQRNKHHQKEMAKILGLDIKKYRELENGKRFPDSELLCILYEKFQIHPSAMLQDKKGIEQEIGFLLEKMDDRMRNNVLGIIKNI